MGLKVYLPIAFLIFGAATAGADVIARSSLAGQPALAALHEHLYWAGVELLGTLLLLSPFVAVACVCALVERRARTRTVLLIFALAMVALLYFYFQGYQAAERAELNHIWTAATLSVAFLPVAVGLPVVLAVVVFGWLATEFDRRISD
jgi:heme/copper-type cytochrome/quinol oxidase subunit 3